MARLVNSIGAGRITAFLVARKVARIAREYEGERIVFNESRTDIRFIYHGQVIDDEHLLFNEAGTKVFTKTLDKLCGMHQTKEKGDEFLFYWNL